MVFLLVKTTANIQLQIFGRFMSLLVYCIVFSVYRWMFFEGDALRRKTGIEFKCVIWKFVSLQLRRNFKFLNALQLFAWCNSRINLLVNRWWLVNNMITSYSKWNKKIANKKTYLRCFSSCLIHAGFISDQPNETVFNLMSCRHFVSRPSPFISFLFLNIHQGKSKKCCPTDVHIKKVIFLGYVLFDTINWLHGSSCSVAVFCCSLW